MKTVGTARPTRNLGTDGEDVRRTACAAELHTPTGEEHLSAWQKGATRVGDSSCVNPGSPA